MSAFSKLASISVSVGPGRPQIDDVTQWGTCN